MKLLLKSFLTGFAVAAIILVGVMLYKSTPWGCEMGEKSPLPVAGTPEYAAVKKVMDRLAVVPALHTEQAEGRVASDWTYAQYVPLHMRGDYWLVWTHYPSKKTMLGCNISGSEAFYQDGWAVVRKRDLREMTRDDFPEEKS